MLKLKTCANKRVRQTCQHVLSRTCECRTAHSHVSQPKNVRGKPRNFPFLKIATNNTRKIRPYPSRWRGVLLCLVFMVFTRQAKVSTCCTQTYKRYLSKHLSRKLSRTLSRKNQGINVTGFTEIRDHNAACRNASVDATDFFLSWQP